MNSIQATNKFYAVLIDADNVSTKYANGVMEEISKYGTPSVKRIYGDWSKPHLNKWKEISTELAITPVQQFGHTSTKNSTDVALVIDAMDLLYTQHITGFCIVSSDSDFTRLVTRLKESAKHVVGMGEKKTPQPFIASCSKFIYLENLIEDDDDDETTTPSGQKTPKQKTRPLERHLKKFIKNATLESSDDDGWVKLSRIGILLNESKPDFDPRNYGCRQLSDVIKHHPKDFEINKDEKNQYVIRSKGKW